MKLEDIHGVHEDHEILVQVDGEDIPVKTYSHDNHKKTITLYLKKKEDMKSNDKTDKTVTRA